MAVFASTAAFVAKQAGLCVLLGKGFVYFVFKCAFILGIFVHASIPVCLFCLVVENMNLFPTPCPLHFPFQSQCFLFGSLMFLLWWLEPFSIHSLLFYYGVLTSSWHAAVEVILPACCSACINPNLSVSPSFRLISVFCLALAVFFLTWHVFLHSALFQFLLQYTSINVFILLCSTVQQPIYSAWSSALPPSSPKIAFAILKPIFFCHQHWMVICILLHQSLY